MTALCTITDTRLTLDKQRVANAFSQAAVEYGRSACVQRDIVDALVNQVNSSIAQNSVRYCVDIGCGTGYLTRQLAQDGQRWLGIDIAEGMLEQAAIITGPSDQIRWQVGDAEDLPIANDTIDLAVSSMALQWATDAHAVMRQLKRVLKPGGQAWLAILRHDALPELHQGWQMLEQSYRVNQFVDRVTWQNAIQSTQLSIERIQAQSFRTYHADVYSLLHSINRIGAGVTQNNGQAKPALTRGNLRQLNQWWLTQHALNNELILTYYVDFYHLKRGV